MHSMFSLKLAWLTSAIWGGGGGGSGCFISRLSLVFAYKSASSALVTNPSWLNLIRIMSSGLMCADIVKASNLLLQNISIHLETKTNTTAMDCKWLDINQAVEQIEFVRFSSSIWAGRFRLEGFCSDLWRSLKSKKLPFCSTVIMSQARNWNIC